MLRNIFIISMAYFGVTVGAGFASGQEPLQYYVSYGGWGLVGAAAILLILPITVLVILQYGSYFNAQDHGVVFNSIVQSWLAKFLDYSLTIAQFCIGFVMMAGAGSNLNQQFGIPTWMGSALMVVLVLLTGLLDVDKVTQVLGYITPAMVVLIIVASIYGIVNMPDNLGETFSTAQQTVDSPLPNWWMSTLNYVGLCMFSGISMAFLIGSSYWNTRAAGWGGFTGGMMFAILLFGMIVALTFQIGVVGTSDLPVLALINELHPVVGVIASIATYGMIFSTTLGVFYSMSKRVTRKKQSWFFPVLVVVSLAGFGLSFLDFPFLVNKVFPILGWLGVLLIAVLLITWFLRGKDKIGLEIRRGDKIRSLLWRRLDPKAKWTTRHYVDLEKVVAASHLDPDVVREEAVGDVFENYDVDTKRYNEDDVLETWEEHSEADDETQYYPASAGWQRLRRVQAAQGHP